MGPPAKWLLGIKLNRGFESLPPRLKEKTRKMCGFLIGLLEKYQRSLNKVLSQSRLSESDSFKLNFSRTKSPKPGERQLEDDPQLVEQSTQTDAKDRHHDHNQDCTENHMQYGDAHSAQNTRTQNNSKSNR